MIESPIIHRHDEVAPIDCIVAIISELYARFSVGGYDKWNVLGTSFKLVPR